MLTFGSEVLDITPSESVPLAGYGYNLGRVSMGVADKLAATVLAVQNGRERVAMCGVDLLSVDPSTVAAVQENIAKQGGLPTTVMINASHTHSGPATRVLHGAGGYNESYNEQVLVPRLTDGILAAFDDMRPGEIGITRSPAPGWSFNRTGGRVLDDRLTAVRVDYEGGSIAGAHFACHPTVLGPSSRLISPDYPGSARVTLAQNSDAQAVLWLTGCAGDVNPAVRKDPNCQRSLAEAERMGVALGLLATDLYRKTQVNAGELSTHSTAVTLPLDAGFELDPGAELEAFRKARRIQDGADTSDVERWLGEMVPIINDNPAEAIAVPVTVLRIGRLVFVGLGAEIYNGTGLEIEAAFPGYDVVTMGTTNAHEGYVPQDRDYRVQGYAARTSAIAFGRRPLRRGSASTVRDAAIAAIAKTL